LKFLSPKAFSFFFPSQAAFQHRLRLLFAKLLEPFAQGGVIIGQNRGGEQGGVFGAGLAARGVSATPSAREDPLP
jgi:hypothetical protein